VSDLVRLGSGAVEPEASVWDLRMDFTTYSLRQGQTRVSLSVISFSFSFGYMVMYVCSQ
jgi:hypothetical protein